MTGLEGVAGDPPPAFLDARAVLRRHGLRPDHRLGQNFLTDPGALERVVEAAELDPHDTVLEIGAGIGTLTSRLAREGRRIVAVELDRRLIEPLLEGVRSFPGVQVVQADVLKLDLAALMQGVPFRVVANIPYQITSHLLRRLMEMPDGPDRVVLTLQAEVVERVVADAGEMSLLALSVQVYGRARRMARIPAGAFFPAPEVDSAVLRIDRHLRPAVAPELIPAFFRVARAGFQQRRKQLHNALSAGLGLGPGEVAAMLERAAVRPDARAQELALADWERLARQLG
ncbi:MAG: ribosomal RNA small subunit methyltransferase A [Chloroflexi bacterium]|nr:ribosomal RNA small subunit methyltransferase A [Chloroflexota bacterium]